MRNTSSALAFFSLATAAAGVSLAGDLAQLIAIGAIFAYSRDQEREADDIGFETMAKVGYEPVQASQIQRHLLDEEAGGKSSKSIFSATHPTTTERIATLRFLADKTTKTGGSWSQAEEARIQLWSIDGLLLQALRFPTLSDGDTLFLSTSEERCLLPFYVDGSIIESSYRSGVTALWKRRHFRTTILTT